MEEFGEIEQELKKVEETIAMADRAIQISRQEKERITADLSSLPEVAEMVPPVVEGV
ncbi:MAG TPA: hypothetical protein VFR31_12100 [Thermoanaerobaculia bacterium]|nr:hypothetical protein [Thermoanaerobaculia bacterium]